jgi:hypothetical protein
VKATIYTGTNPLAESENSAWKGSGCGIETNVASGWLGAQVHLVKGDGTLCGSTPWEFNSGSAWIKYSSIFLFETSCPQSGASDKAEAHAQYWNDDANSYVKSPWINSPYQNV